ncbi:MAG TPA: gamma-glutamyl-gamma-aminobutyrate hydrolase family protein [Polyangiaceae bacterium]|nr:gamma-glutamyl-gamma-aminobutyrate hydrolase family protein [Polyangiaceae bacterium]
MKRAVIVQHAEVEGAGRIADLLTELGYSLSAHTLKQRSDLPSNIADTDLLIVMGGSMGVGDLGAPGFDYLEAEVALLKQRVAKDAPVLGVCLGAQLLAHAAGAAVHPMKGAGGRRLYEVGWGPIAFHRAGNEAVLDGIPDRAVVVHWHGDQFALPPGARLLASSDLCNQGFQLGRRLFGLQFHCELDAAQIEDFLQEDLPYVEQANGSQGAARIRADTQENIASFRALGGRLLGNIIQAMSER